MLTVGLTGGICTGKSTASTLLTERFGARVIDADTLAHQLIEPGAGGYQPVISIFGESILDSESRINRELVAEKIFSSSDLRYKLNQVMHPLIMAEIQRQLAQLRKDHVRAAVISAALLLEAGYHKLFDKLIVILSNPELQIKRLVEKRGLNRVQAMQRIESQWDNEQRIKIKECFKVWNNGGVAEFENTLVRVWEEIVREVG